MTEALKTYRIVALFSWDGLQEGDALMDVQGKDRLHALDVYTKEAMGYQDLDDYLLTTGDPVYFEAHAKDEDAEDKS